MLRPATTAQYVAPPVVSAVERVEVEPEAAVPQGDLADVGGTAVGMHAGAVVDVSAVGAHVADLVV